MLKSYEAVYEDGKLRWIREQPASKKMRVLVTVLEEETDAATPAALKAMLERAKGCVRPRKSIEEIDADIREVRAEWEREWDR